jgi:hypothetical protein
MNTLAKILRVIDWKIALMAAVTTPLVVLFHELAHIVVLELGGIDAQLCGFSMGTPVGYSWDFKGLEAAASFYHVNGRAIAYAALAGPLTTLFFAVGVLMAHPYKNARIAWGGTLCALALRMAGITEFLPRFLDGSMNASDEAIVAHFLGVPLSSFYWPSLALGYLCIFLLYRAAEKGQRFSHLFSAMIGGTFGYFGIDILANLLVFRPDVWGR